MHLVGIIRLTEEEASRLPHKPAKLYGGKEGEYAGVLEVFHQLHCLVRSCYQLVPDHRILMLRRIVSHIMTRTASESTSTTLALA
jgi:hypothetical protein